MLKAILTTIFLIGSFSFSASAGWDGKHGWGRGDHDHGRHGRGRGRYVYQCNAFDHYGYRYIGQSRWGYHEACQNAYRGCTYQSPFPRSCYVP